MTFETGGEWDCLEIKKKKKQRQKYLQEKNWETSAFKCGMVEKDT